MTQYINRSDSPKEVTLSHGSIADREIQIIKLKEGDTIILRPHFIVGILKPIDSELKIHSHWMLGHLQSWITLQLRFFEFYGPCKIALWGTRGIRIEKFEEGNEKSGKVTNEASVVGFSPTLNYHSRRAENFWPYLWGKNALFDDHFSGQGYFLCQQISKNPDGSNSGKFWERFFELIGKPFGL